MEKWETCGRWLGFQMDNFSCDTVHLNWTFTFCYSLIFYKSFFRTQIKRCEPILLHFWIKLSDHFSFARTSYNIKQDDKERARERERDCVKVPGHPPARWTWMCPPVPPHPHSSYTCVYSYTVKKVLADFAVCD